MDGRVIAQQAFAWSGIGFDVAICDKYIYSHSDYIYKMGIKVVPVITRSAWIESAYRRRWTLHYQLDYRDCNHIFYNFGLT